MRSLIPDLFKEEYILMRICVQLNAFNCSGKMISVIYLISIVCVSANSAEFTNMECGNSEKVLNGLEVAEKEIQSAKKYLLSNRLSALPLDCEDLVNNGVNKSGVYLVWPKNRLISGSISVYCDMETDGGGWTVIQRRGNFSHEKDYFYQDWRAYKEGFGNLKEDFWLGNDNIYALSNQKRSSIRFDLGALDGSKAHALFNNFWIEDETNGYKLHVSGYSGTAGDSFSFHSGWKFTTKDRDNDGYEANCANLWKGAWWFTKCHPSHLNGLYHGGKPPGPWDGIIWRTWKGNKENPITTEMKIRKTRSWMK